MVCVSGDNLSYSLRHWRAHREEEEGGEVMAMGYARPIPFDPPLESFAFLGGSAIGGPAPSKPPKLGFTLTREEIQALAKVPALNTAWWRQPCLQQLSGAGQEGGGEGRESCGASSQEEDGGTAVDARAAQAGSRGQGARDCRSQGEGR